MQETLLGTVLSAVTGHAKPIQDCGSSCGDAVLHCSPTMALFSAGAPLEIRAEAVIGSERGATVDIPRPEPVTPAP